MSSVSFKEHVFLFYQGHRHAFRIFAKLVSKTKGCELPRSAIEVLRRPPWAWYIRKVRQYCDLKGKGDTIYEINEDDIEYVHHSTTMNDRFSNPGTSMGGCSQRKANNETNTASTSLQSCGTDHAENVTSQIRIRAENVLSNLRNSHEYQARGPNIGAFSAFKSPRCAKNDKCTLKQELCHSGANVSSKNG